MKWCNGCKQRKELKEFSNNKSRKDGKNTQCKECLKQLKKQWNKNNPEYHKQYRENNKEYHKQQNKEWYENNKEYRSQQTKQYNNSPISWYDKTKARKEIEKYEEIDESENGNLVCKCTYCREWFEPTRIQIKNRVAVINGKGYGGCNLYCSEECKENCPVFRKKLYPEGQRPETDREVQFELREIVFERDNYTCQNCNTHANNLDVNLNCHHIFPINEDPIQSLDKDVCKTLCEECHREVHQQPGCTYNELKCSY